MFLDDLQRLPREREIEFTIDLLPCSELAAKAPYIMAVKELQKLKSQLQEIVRYKINHGQVPCHGELQCYL